MMQVSNLIQQGLCQAIPLANEINGFAAFFDFAVFNRKMEVLY